jgi:probable F420-dependent oxidoreductase
VDHPRIGIGLPILGPHATPAAMATVATTADRLGYHSVSTYERLLLPATPGWVNEAGLPDWPAFDAIEALTWVAAITRRVRLVTGVVNPLFQPPVVLARRLATLDVLSAGRVDVGIGSGWLPEEFAAVGVPLSRRGAGFEEHLAAMRSCWGPDPVEHDGRHYPIAPARIGPKPLQQPLPVLLGAVAPIAVERAARLADGFIVGFRDWESTLEQIAVYRAAGGTGRIVLRAGPLLPHPRQPVPATTWSPPSMVDDLARAAAEGVDEVIWDLNIVELPIPDQLVEYERLATTLGLAAAG